MNSACMRQRRWALPGAARASGTAGATTLHEPAPPAAREGTQHEPAPPRPWGRQPGAAEGLSIKGGEPRGH